MISLIPLENTWRPEYNDMMIKGLGQTLQMVLITLIVGGIIGLIMGIALFASRKGGLFSNKPTFFILNLLVNFIRPIPFVIFIGAVQPLTLVVSGRTIGVWGAIFPMIIMCAAATSRIVEQSLVNTDPGIIEAGRAMGASRMHVLCRILIPEALAPLILGYAFLFIGILDMSAVAGAVGAGGLGDFAIVYGYRKWNYLVTWAALAVIFALVMVVQSLGNWLSRKVLHR